MNITWVEKSKLMTTAMAAMKPGGVLLDIGCGIVPQQYVRPLVHVCCEPYQEYVDHLRKKVADVDSQDRTYLILNMGWQEAVKHFPEKSVDTVILVDVIEHLEKEDALKLLEATEKIVRGQLILFTPWGFMPQHHDDGKDAWGLNGGAWQEHKSGWLPEDFTGDEWQFFASEDFHGVDSNGRALEKPYGAFWAIKTYRDGAQSHDRSREQMLHHIEVEARERMEELAKRERQLEQVNGFLSVRIERKIRRLISS